MYGSWLFIEQEQLGHVCKLACHRAGATRACMEVGFS